MALVGRGPCPIAEVDPMSDSLNSSASVADSESGDQTMLLRTLAARKDDYLRLASDFENFRKRTRRDSEQQAAAEKESFIRDLLPIFENPERALACEAPVSSEQMHRGVAMTVQQLGVLLDRHGIQAVDDVGQPFDPHRHEAVALEGDPRQPDHVVLEVIQRGYRRGDKVFRPAKVIVNDSATFRESVRPLNFRTHSLHAGTTQSSIRKSLEPTRSPLRAGCDRRKSNGDGNPCETGESGAIYHELLLNVSCLFSDQ